MRSGFTTVRVGVELDEVEAAERRGVLVLPAAREPEVDALDAVRELGQLVGRERFAAATRASTPISATTSVDDEPSPEPGGASEWTHRSAPRFTLERLHRRLDQVEVAVERASRAGGRTCDHMS